MSPVAAATGGTAIRVDKRWDGAHGIGRYAREVLTRLDVEWIPLELDGSPSSLASSLRRPRVPAQWRVYSPGYNPPTRGGTTVLTVHDLIHLAGSGPKRFAYSAYYRRVIRPVIQRAGVVITVSETSRRAIQEWLADSTVEVVNAGIGRSAAFTPLSRVPEPKRAASLLYVGNLRPHKNVAIAFHALALVPDATLRMLIPDAEHHAARALAEETGVARRLTLLPRLSDEQLADEYRSAAATLLPSTLEGFGLPAMESISCGTPVIYWSGCASVSEIVGRKGFAVTEAHDPEAWAEAVNQLVSDPRTVEPPSDDKYSWERTSRIVSETLGR